MNAPASLRRLDVSVASGDSLDIRHFRVSERMSGLFEVNLRALSPNPEIDLETAVGGSATFSIFTRPGASRTWTGIVSSMRLVTAEERGLSTYEVTIVPRMWLLTQNVDYRIFQQMSEIDIVQKVLGKWGIAVSLRLTTGFKKRKYRVQYEESDYNFVCRMLEDAGVSFHFDEDGTMVLSDAPHEAPPRATMPFRAAAATGSEDHVTNVSFERSLRAGRVTVRDHDYRKPPAYRLLASASAEGAEAQIERYHYRPGSFLFESDKGESTPFADDKGKYRADEGEGAKLAGRLLGAQRSGAKTLSFKTNAIDVGAGTVVSFSDHPNGDIGGGKPYLVAGVEMEGDHDGEWTHLCKGGGTFLAEHQAHRPKVSGVESATVVGPPGEEIHVDEFGRIRVHFHWDREGKMDDTSSCWIHVSQPWGGSGYGGLNLPRVGQEVIVDFLNGDPDRPVVVGRVFTNLQRVPYKLPENKTQTVFRSQSTNGKDGYNEIRYEDQAGSELFKVQAERDYHKLVKNDEVDKINRDQSEQVGRDRKVEVAHDDALTVGNDRKVAIGHDDALTVGNDQEVQIAHDQSVRVGNDRGEIVGANDGLAVGVSRSVAVGMNDALFVGVHQSQQIGANRSVQVGGDHSESIGSDMKIQVGGSLSQKVSKSKSEAVMVASSELVGGAKTITVGGMYGVTVGGMMTTNVALIQQESVGGAKTVTVGNVLTITCGASTLTMDKSGMIVVSGADVLVSGTGTVNLNATGDVNVTSAKNVRVTGCNIQMN